MIDRGGQLGASRHPWWRRRSCALAYVALLGLLAAGAIGGSPGVTLEIRNAGERPMRCVLVLAHFVSTDLAPLPAGGTLWLSLDRDPDAGTLSVRREDGRDMMVENLLCGAADHWQDTRAEVPLLPLRSDTPARMHTECKINTRLACTEPAPAP